MSSSFSASVNPVAYMGAEPVFIDSERDTWNMSPEALERAFETYSDVKLVVIAHLFVEVQRGDGGGDLDALGSQKVFILLQGLDDGSPHALALILGQDEDGEQAAFVGFSPIRADGAAANDCVTVTNYIKVGPSSPLHDLLRAEFSTSFSMYSGE